MSFDFPNEDLMAILQIDKEKTLEEDGWKVYFDGVSNRAVKQANDSRVGPFNQKKFRVRALVFSARLNPSFFGPDRANPQLIGWLEFFFLVFY